MIRPLREYHFFAWKVIVLLLLIMFILVIALRPKSVSTYAGVENNFIFNLKKLPNSTAQLTVQLRGPLSAASCVVYVNTGKDEILAGRIDGKDIWRFELPVEGNSVTVRLYDFIHKTDIVEQLVIQSE
jgi:hypothetical protein